MPTSGSDLNLIQHLKERSTSLPLLALRTKRKGCPREVPKTRGDGEAHGNQFLPNQISRTLRDENQWPSGFEEKQKMVEKVRRCWLVVAKP